MDLRQLFLQNNVVLSNFLNCLLTFFSAGQLFYKSLNKKIQRKAHLLLLLFGLSLSVLYSWVAAYSAQLAQVISFAGPTVIFSLSLRENRNRTVAIAFMSNGFANFLKFVSAITAYAVFQAFGIHDYHMYVLLIADVLMLIQAELIVRFKRLRNGIQFFQMTENLGLGLFFSSIIFILTSVDIRHRFISDSTLLVLLAGITVSGIGMFIWVRSNITKYYKAKLRDRDAARYLAELETNREELERLRRTNELLAGVVHRDNHLFSTIKAAADNAQNTEEIAEDIRVLIRERGELIEKEVQKTALMPETGDRMLDCALHTLALKAVSKGIGLSVNTAAPITEIIGDKLCRTALQTLISDHVKDALIAVGANGGKNGKILLNFALDSGEYTITIFDNGVPFDIATFDRLGRERVTTHADWGGTGTGFMQTFDTLRSCGGSLVITEFAEGQPFSKSVGFRFDGKGRFIIQSPRADKIKNALTREDVSVCKI